MSETAPWPTSFDWHRQGWAVCSRAEFVPSACKKRWAAGALLLDNHRSRTLDQAHAGRHTRRAAVARSGGKLLCVLLSARPARAGTILSDRRQTRLPVPNQPVGLQFRSGSLAPTYQAEIDPLIRVEI